MKLAHFHRISRHSTKELGGKAIRTNIKSTFIIKRSFKTCRTHYSEVSNNRSSIDESLFPPSMRDRESFFHQDPRSDILAVAFEEPLSSTKSGKITGPSKSIVGTYGWNTDSLSRAAEKKGYPGIAHGMFPGGALDLISYFVENANKQMVIELETIELDHMTLKDRIKIIIKTRLSLLAPFIHNWQQALAVLAQPSNVPQALQQIAVLSDEMAYLSGDKSTDFNWYTKRTLIAGIYAASELHMLTDASPNFVDTWTFLERRIDDAIQISQTAREAEKIVTTVAQGAGSVISSTFGSPQSYIAGAFSLVDQFGRFAASVVSPTTSSSSSSSTTTADSQYSSSSNAADQSATNTNNGVPHATASSSKTTKKTYPNYIIEYKP